MSLQGAITFEPLIAVPMRLIQTGVSSHLQTPAGDPRYVMLCDTNVQ